MLYILIIAYMAFFSRMAGGGFGAKYLDRFKLTWLPELFFAAGFGLAAYQYSGWIGVVPTMAWSYLWMQTGHGTVLHWGKEPWKATGERKQFLTPVVNWLAGRLGFEIGGVNYCRLFMAVKGFLIGLPVGGMPLAVLWPLGYEIGQRFKSHAVKELVSGAGAGLAICIFIYLLT